MVVMREVLNKIKPSKAEHALFQATTTCFLKKINSNLKKAEAILGGSGAKDTWLSGSADVDIFVRFDYDSFSSQKKSLSDLLEEVLKKSFPKLKIERLHGSRDYFQLVYEHLHFEVVPILKIAKAEEAKNITDISPLHALWVNKNSKKIKDEIRLAKQFCKAHSLYGAESHIMGFSGYVLEILVVFYGSFEKLLRASLTWKEKEVIDVEHYYQKKEALFHLNQSKLQSPLVVIDPVDKLRNAAAALSLKKLNIFKQKARDYLKKPNADFFLIKKVIKEELEKEALAKKWHLVFIKVKPLSGKEDVVGAKLLKVFQFLEVQLESFGVKKGGWDFQRRGDGIFYFMLEKKELPKEFIQQGPPLTLTEYVFAFKKKYKETFENQGKIFAKVKRKMFRLEDNVLMLLKDSYVEERIAAVVDVLFD